jgi:ketosteroid isomerase-like protein
MQPILRRIMFFFSLAALLTVPSQSQTEAANDEQALWNLEHSYWNFVQKNDLPAYLGLWHKNFVGWPSVSAAPVHKDHITDWITSQTSKGLALKAIEFKPAAVQVTGNVAVTYYWMTYKWTDQAGKGETRTIRVTHTLVRDGSRWHIIGGMSMLEGSNPPK